MLRSLPIELLLREWLFAPWMVLTTVVLIGFSVVTSVSPRAQGLKLIAPH